MSKYFKRYSKKGKMCQICRKGVVKISEMVEKNQISWKILNLTIKKPEHSVIVASEGIKYKRTIYN